MRLSTTRRKGTSLRLQRQRGHLTRYSTLRYSDAGNFRS